MVHDLLLKRKDGSLRCFRIYGRPIPKEGDIVALPVDGRLIKTCVKGSSKGPEIAIAADAETVEIFETLTS